MTPEQIAAITALLRSAASWPIWMVVLMVIVGPWIVLGFVMRQVEKNQSKRFEEVVRMYENNVELVKGHEQLNKNYEKVTDDYKKLVAITTEVVTELRGLIKNNLYCPMVRRETHSREEIRG